MRLSINKDILPIEVMDTPSKRKIGMMGREKLDGGMLFLFPNVQEQSFWMKNCKIPLDIIMLVDNEVTQIHKNCLPCQVNKCELYQGIGNQVLELNGGETNRLGIKKGMELQFN